ncbi:hypothetical protein [Mesobacillus foraminis]|uniref:hypothetical protein n=1 Tax=Mesobacillus foraminis TaxID=279826 RepID=UPI000EF46132|nr:hypothetical protein [Mesobacillus foraminis]
MADAKTARVESGKIDWDKSVQEEVFYSQEGTKFVQKYNVPLWVGEFGAVYKGLEMRCPID